MTRRSPVGDQRAGASARWLDGFTTVTPSSRRGARFQASPIGFWCPVQRIGTDRSGVGANTLLRHEAASSGRVDHGDRRPRVNRFRRRRLAACADPLLGGGLLGGSMKVRFRIVEGQGT
jgi:hypothetical protein